MAVAPANEDAFFREVDEELRRQQLQTVWQRYGRLIIIGIVAALALLAGFLYWQHVRTQAREAHAEALSGAIADLGDSKEAPAKAALATLAGSDDANYAAAARLTQAGLMLAKNDAKGAAAAYRAIAADDAVAQPFRDLATVRGTAAEYDTLPPQQAIDRLKPLAVPGGPWFGSAGEMTAVAWLKLNQPAKAGQLFAGIAKDQAVPETLRARAVRISGMLGVDATPAATETR